MFFKVIIQLTFLLFMFHGNLSAIKFKCIFFGDSHEKNQLSQEELDSKLIEAVEKLQDIVNTRKTRGKDEQAMLLACVNSQILKLLKLGADPYATTPDDEEVKTIILVYGTKKVRKYLENQIT